jgi:hypothetical protein
MVDLVIAVIPRLRKKVLDQLQDSLRISKDFSL